MKRIGITACKIIKYNEIDNNRYVDCPDYDDCLDQAVRGGMVSFTCKNCHAFKEFKKAKELNITYEVKFPGRRVVVKKFRPGYVDLREKNTGTLWWD